MQQLLKGLYMNFKYFDDIKQNDKACYIFLLSFFNKRLTLRGHFMAFNKTIRIIIHLQKPNLQKIPILSSFYIHLFLLEI